METPFLYTGVARARLRSGLLILNYGLGRWRPNSPHIASPQRGQNLSTLFQLSPDIATEVRDLILTPPWSCELDPLPNHEGRIGSGNHVYNVSF